MNINTLAYLVGGTTQGTIAKFSGNSTAETAFLTNANAASGLGAGPAILSVPGTFWAPFSPAGSVSLFNQGRVFRVHAHGVATTDKTANLTIAIYQVPADDVADGTGGTLANDVIVTSTDAMALNTTSGSWVIDADLRYESIVGTLSGLVTSQVKNNAINGPEAIEGTSSGLVEADLNFILAVTFSDVTTTNSAVVDEFSISLVQ